MKSEDSDIRIIASAFAKLFKAEDDPLEELACLVLADCYKCLSHLREAYTERKTTKIM